MTTVTVFSNFEAQENKICHCLNSFPFLFPWSHGTRTRCHYLIFLMLSFKSTFSLSSFTLINRLLVLPHFLPLECYYLHIWGCLVFLPAIFILACDSAHPVFHIMYSAYKLNKQGDNIQPCHTPFLILNQWVVPCPVLTGVSWLTYGFLRRQVRWLGTPISLKIFHCLLWSTESKAVA